MSMSQSVKYNLNQKGKRKTLYDHEGYTREGATYTGMEDHLSMKSHVFADFQKEQFRLRKIARKRRFKIRLVVVIVTFLLILGFLLAWENGFFDFFSSNWSPTG